MGVSGIGAAGYPMAGYEVRRAIRNTSGTGFDNTVLGGTGYIKEFADTRRKTFGWSAYL